MTKRKSSLCHSVQHWLVCFTVDELDLLLQTQFAGGPGGDAVWWTVEQNQEPWACSHPGTWSLDCFSEGRGRGLMSRSGMDAVEGSTINSVCGPSPSGHQWNEYILWQKSLNIYWNLQMFQPLRFFHWPLNRSEIYVFHSSLMMTEKSC